MTRKEEREEAAREYTKKWYKDLGIEPEDYPTDAKITIDEFTKGAEWADSTAWKPADGDSLPEIDREVIALVEEYGYYKAVFAHRPNPNGNAICYDEGGWNQPNVKWWLDLELPKMED